MCCSTTPKLPPVCLLNVLEFDEIDQPAIPIAVVSDNATSPQSNQITPVGKASILVSK
jgi:hypothetical protein